MTWDLSLPLFPLLLVRRRGSSLRVLLLLHNTSSSSTSSPLAFLTLLYQYRLSFSLSHACIYTVYTYIYSPFLPVCERTLSPSTPILTFSFYLLPLLPFFHIPFPLHCLSPSRSLSLSCSAVRALKYCNTSLNYLIG